MAADGVVALLSGLVWLEVPEKARAPTTHGPSFHRKLWVISDIMHPTARTAEIIRVEGPI